MVFGSLWLVQGYGLFFRRFLLELIGEAVSPNIPLVLAKKIHFFYFFFCLTDLASIRYTLLNLLLGFFGNAYW
jgi:hypothetical protein